MKKIQLTRRDKKRIYVKVDDDVYEWESKYHWSQGDKGIVMRKEGSSNYPIRLAREIMHPKKGIEVSYINGNTLDCRRENIRFSDYIKTLNKQKIIDPETGAIRIMLSGKLGRKVCFS